MTKTETSSSVFIKPGNSISRVISALDPKPNQRNCLSESMFAQRLDSYFFFYLFLFLLARATRGQLVGKWSYMKRDVVVGGWVFTKGRHFRALDLKAGRIHQNGSFGNNILKLEK